MDTVFKLFIQILSSLIPIRKYRKRFRWRYLDPEYLGYVKAKKYVTRYLHVLNDSDPVFRPVDSTKLPVWQLWLQGARNAPGIVKKCLDSVKCYCADRDIYVLDQDNYRDYIDLPLHIIDKYERGIITRTHFSDIIRVFLLKQYGGTWIDATVFLTGSIPQVIQEEPYFAFSIPKNSNQSRVFLSSSWFIHALPEHIFFENSAKLLSEYWLHENVLINYFLLHIFQKSMIDHSPRLRKIWADVPNISNVEPHILQSKLMLPFDPLTLREIVCLTPIHKLTYKFDTIPAGSLLERLLKNKPLLS